MKKRVLSALLALCMACTLAGNVWAAEETEPTPAPSAGVEAQTVEPQTVEPTPSAEPTQAPAPSPDATAEPEATPEPSAAPSAAPDATVEPDATPAPTEEPEATAAPAATATPDATAEPTATPAPTEAPAPTATPEPSDAPEATAAPAVSYVAPVQTEEDQQINVHVDVPEGAFAENVAPTLHAQLITGETEEEQAELEKAAAQVAEQTGAAFDGMLALDVYFTDANAEDPEQEIEPALPVSVRFELSENVLPEGYDPATLAVHHLAEEKDAAGEPVTDENGEAAVTVETVANAVTDDAEVPGVVALSDAAAEAAEAPAEVARIADLPAPETAATPADEQAAAEAEQALADPAVVAEFAVNTFSTFVITWGEEEVNETRNSLVVSCVVEIEDENGELRLVPITTDPEEFWVEKDSSTTLITIANLSDTGYSASIPAIDGYTFAKKAYYQASNSDTYTQIARLRFQKSYNQQLNVQYNTNSTGNNGWENVENGTVYFVYSRDMDRALTIVDTVNADGNFTATWENEPQGKVKYTWYRSTSSNLNQHNAATSGTVVEDTVAVTLNDVDYYNLSEDAQSLNVALDSKVANVQDNQRYYYIVKAEVNGSVYWSNTMQAPYYVALQNGDFESPNRSSGYGNTNFKYKDNPDGFENYQQVYWHTTATDGEIEIIRVNEDSKSGGSWDNFEVSVLPITNDDGDDQIAELNANQASALYQDVLSVPGTTYNWQLQHRVRTKAQFGGKYSEPVEHYEGSDTMYVVIMSTEKAAQYTTQAQIDALISQYRNQLEDVTLENGNKYKTYTIPNTGISIWEITDSSKENWNNTQWSGDPANWYQYSGIYEVPEGQYSTRFFFAAGDTAYDKYTQGNIEPLEKNKQTVGNLLDDVWFSTKLPPAGEGEANLTLTKTVTGIDLSQNTEYSVTIKVGSAEYTFDSGDFERVGASWTASQAVKVTANSNYTVTETVSGAPINYEETVSVEGSEGVNVSGNSASFRAVGRGSYEVEFTNSYEAKEPLVPGHRKYIKANTDGTYDLTLDVTGKIESTQSDPTQLDILYVLDNSSSMDGNISYFDNESRLEAAKKAIESLEDELKIDGLSVQHALAIFSSDSFYGYTHDNSYVYQEWTQNTLNLSRISTTNYQYGTNYVDGIELAEDVLSKGTRPEAVQVVVFISDGEPNAPGDYPLWSAQQAIKDLNADHLYAIGVSGDVGLSTLQDLIDSAEKISSSNKAAYSSSDSDDLVKIFTDLAAKFTSVDCSNVTITDTLSDYAKLTDDANFNVVITDENGRSYSSTNISSSHNSIASGVETTINVGEGTDKTEVKAIVTYDADSKVFTLSFPNHTLVNGWKYAITTQIEPTDEAYETYEANLKTDNDGYNGVKGDPGTDADDENVTSSGKRGFHSNNSATLTYVSNGVDAKEDYDHPVIQVTKGDLQITKKVKGVQTTNGFSFTVTKLDEEGDKTNETYTVTVTDGKTKTVNGLLPGNYLVEEIKPSNIENYTYKGVTYKVGDDQPVNDAPTVEVKAGGVVEITATNTYEMVTHSLTVKKNVTGGMGDTTKPFTFTVTGIDDGEYDGTETIIVDGKEVETDIKVTVSNGKFTLKDGQSITFPELSVSGNYTVAEEEVAGYTQTAFITSGVGNVNGHSYSTTSLTKDTVVTFENHREVVTPTGLESNHTKPYALMVGAGALAGLALVGGILARRARRRREW